MRRPLEEFEKEIALQERKLVSMLNKLDSTNSRATRNLATEAARVANTYMMQDRFGYFSGEDRCIVYANMGPTNLPVMALFKTRVRFFEADMLGSAVWPKQEPYTFAVVIDDDWGQRWQEELIECWQSYWDDSERRARKKRRKR